MKNILQNSYLIVDWDQVTSLISIEWYKETEDMGAEEYKDILLQLSDFVLQNKIKNWLGNTRDFSFPISSSLQEWTSGTFNENLIAAGLEKMALVIPTSLVANLSVQQTVDQMNTKHTDQKFETKYFDTVGHAMDWLKN